jgi:hypothetical protein
MKKTAEAAQTQEIPALTRNVTPELKIECFSGSGDPDALPPFNNG